MIKTKQWICPTCGYIYEENTPFENLIVNWICPICGTPKDDFILE